MTVFHLTCHCVNEHIEYKYSHSFLVFIIGHDILAKYKAITSAFNVQNALYMEPSDENNDFSCIYFFYEFDRNMSGDYI